MSAQQKINMQGYITAAYSATDEAGTPYELNITSSTDRSGAMTGTLRVGMIEYVLVGDYRFRNSTGAQTDIYFAGSNERDHYARSGYFILEASDRRYESLKGKRVCCDPHTQTLRILDIEFVRITALP
ncbi:hypothetical protein D3C76_764690 [compost metagenome]|jgi:hypothetical protein|uniref:Uncharacterized protein n=1 Tax=Pseudomonas neuropathica TaxID=2730425 RepID=A0ACC7MPR2_9PSED|nr:MULTISPECIES: hypothetical protein [Pseudomonas]MDD2101768.1 hypothetical protein [Pseudomonas putida]MEB2515149.1 hypothetical protein [Pseudomonas sp. YuFO20]MEB2621882.1 hypothetical protein [Pseudomonas sp. YuFO8]